MNYKLSIILAAIAFIFASCTKDNPEMPDNTKAVPLKITLSMPPAPQPGDGVTRVAFEKDAANPLRLAAKWKSGDEMVLILFQGDNATWKDNCPNPTAGGRPSRRNPAVTVLPAFPHLTSDP